MTIRLPIVVIAVCLAGGVATSAAPQSDLDAFMQQVLARRDENWKKLQQYILDEKEQVELRGIGGRPLWGDRRESTWYIREGFFIKSPLKVNGVAVPEDERLKLEDEFLDRARERERRAKEEAARAAKEATAQAGAGTATAPPAGAGTTPPAAAPTPADTMTAGNMDAFLRQTRAPDFIDAAYFLRFKFESGRYALVGRETFDGHDVLRIEYYPAKLFTDEKGERTDATSGAPPAERKPPSRGDQYEDAIQRMMNKVSLVTLWVEPKSSQIVKYTFDNVNFDFLPAAWLFRVTDLKASMTMTQAFPDVWLPKSVEFYFEGMLAVGAFDARYHIDYSDYRQATTGARIRRDGGN